MSDAISRFDAQKLVYDYCHARTVEGRQLKSPAVFTTHTGTDLAEAIGTLPAVQPDAREAALRAALDGLLTLVEHANFEEGWCCCGDDMLHHQSPMDCGHTPVDMGEYHASLAIKKARAALKGDSRE